MNQLQIIFTKKNTMPDRRYRLMVNLHRSDRPRYWNFMCFNCGAGVVSIQNREVTHITDFYDPQDLNNAGIAKDCKGTLSTGRACPYTYFFNVS